MRAALLLGLLLAARPGASPAQDAPVPVAVAAVTAATLTDTVEATGTLEASQTAELLPRVAGRQVLEVWGREGDPVAAGELLARLDSALVEAQLLGLGARLRAAEARLAATDARLALLATDGDRARSLFAQGVAPRQTLDRAEAELAVVRAERDAVAAEGAALAESRRELVLLADYHRVTAPWAGVVLARHVDPGAVTSATRPLFTLGRLDPLRLRVGVPEARLPRVRAGQRVRVTVDALPGRAFEARVVRVLPGLDPATHAGDVEVHLDAGGTGLRPGMFARARVETGSRTALLVPQDAVRRVPGSGGSFAYVVTAAGVAERRELTLGTASGAEVEILRGLARGERVVVRGEGLLRSGAPVRVVGGP